MRCPRAARSLAAGFAVAASLLATAPGVPQENPLLDQIRAAFQKRSSSIQRVRILEMRASQRHAWGIDWPYVIVAHGIREDGRYQDSFDDELFGVFLADTSLERIIATVDVLPTRRWSDYSFSIESLEWPRLVIHGSGDTYGDNEQRKTYDLSDFDPQDAP